MKQEYKKLGTANRCKKEDLIRFHGILEDVLLQDNNICDKFKIKNVNCFEMKNCIKIPGNLKIGSYNNINNANKCDVNIVELCSFSNCDQQLSGDTAYIRSSCLRLRIGVEVAAGWNADNSNSL
ncbi:hypothetical protein KUTeg_011583 [Tegillarca granosa]|uniref:Uncharacterized protein n=1 Tax=Tegillarca granosa TaxID=220873 RepID=A0ABQ9F2E3_TEGGR|nr:hypothetical protein KUTeg_011583 [Tegillarca granosa]